MRWSTGFLALLVGTTATGTTLHVDLKDGCRSPVKLESPVDDAHLANPVGYFAPEKPVARVVRSITVENIGPTAIQNPDVRINGAPLLPLSDPLDAMGLGEKHDLLALFSKWRDRAVHATTDLDENQNPLAILHDIGAGFCGDDARALAAITFTHGATVRFARLNGHSVAEHRLDGDWMLLDGDQNLFYLDWDNRTPVSEDDIQADPLLALRTQVFGRQTPAWELSASWQNTSRFEFVDLSHAQKIFRLKHAPPPRNWELMPGEKIVIDLTRTPDRICAANAGLQKNPTLRAVTCVVDFHQHRSSGAAIGKLSLPYPLVDPASGAPHYEIEIPRAPVVACQAASAQFPSLRSGENVVEVKSRGRLRVTFEIEPANLQPTPAPVVRIGGPRLLVDAKDADRLWWQIASDPDFHLVPPNFDRVAPFAPEITLSPIDRTFLSQDTEYFVRAKVRHDGVWSDWSRTARFTPDKPAQPRIARLEGADGDQTRIQWQPGRGDMLVFGSNRLDFLPEVYGSIEVTRMENGAIREKRPNHNLLTVVPAKDGEAYVPVRSCYRLIARDNGRLSVPSPLARPANPPPARVLQNRHEKPEGSLIGRDIAVEMEVP